MLSIDSHSVSLAVVQLVRVFCPLNGIVHSYCFSQLTASCCKQLLCVSNCVLLENRYGSVYMLVHKLWHDIVSVDILNIADYYRGYEV